MALITLRDGETACEGKDGRGDKIIAAKCVHSGEETTFGVWVCRKNYSLGKMVPSWRYIKTGLTREKAIAEFHRLNKVK